MNAFDPLKDVSFPRQHPVKDVADHEVLMAFNGDAEAIAFREWWTDGGAAAFKAWLDAQKSKAEFPAFDFGTLHGSPLDEQSSFRKCVKCGREMTHFRLKGYRCPTCD